MKPIAPVRCSNELPPKGVPVIVAGGTAMLKTGGEWFSGMEEPLYQRPLAWKPQWWARIPTDNDVPPPDRLAWDEEKGRYIYAPTAQPKER